MRWLDREQLTESGELGGLKSVICEWYYFLFYSFSDFLPVDLYENRSDVVVFWGFSKSTGERL